VLADLGYENVHVRHADGTLGWLEHAPFDAIVVTAGGPKVPSTLREQLRVGGRLVIPVGSDPRVQELVRVTRIAEDEYKQEDLADVRFVPLIGEEGWEDRTKRRAPAARKAPSLAETIADRCEAFRRPDDLDFAPLLQRIGDARIVLIGEATHGTSEFYSLRADITRELIEKKGFDFVAIEGDWPDAARIDHYVRHFEYKPSEWTAFARFPTWMWRNREVRAFVDWLREHNKHVPAGQRVAFHGLDLYSLYDSIRSILKYLDDVDPETARIARERYGCLTPWQADPAAYGHAAISGTYQVCENPVAAMLKELQGKRQAYAEHDGERFLDMTQNAQLVANAEKYYRTMYYGSRASWNLRDRHMFATLKSLLDHHGPSSKAVVWAHNSHLGNAEATEMFARGEINLGHLCRNEFGDAIYAIGFGTNTGTVAAASEWGAPMEVKEVRPAIVKSYERLCHDTDKENFLLPLRNFPRPSESESLWSPRLQRAIGVIYRPETEIASHYFQAVLPRQFDEYIWLDRTHAVTPFDTDEMAGMPDTYPFGL
jgi:erythromycin esterase-like protein